MRLAGLDLVRLRIAVAGRTALEHVRDIDVAALQAGEVDVLGFLRGFVREPVVTLRAALGARRALKSLEALA